MVMTDILFKEFTERIMEERGCLKKPCVQDLLSDVFPQPFDDVEVRGIRREEDKVDSKFRRFVLYCLAMLVSGIVKDEGYGDVTALIPNFFKEGLDLPGIHIFHRMGLNEIQRKRVDGPEQVESVPSCACREIKLTLAPYLAGECLKGEMHGIHEQKPSSALFRFGYNRLNICNPLLLFLRVGLAGNRLKFPVIHPGIAHQHPRPCETERVATDSTDYIHCFFCASRHSFYKGFRHSVPLTSETIGATFFFFGEENVLQSVIVIEVNHLIHEIAAGAGESRNGLASHTGILHLCQKNPASLSYSCAETGSVYHLFEGRYDFFRIFDG